MFLVNSERRAYLQLVFTQQLQRDFLLSLQTADEQSARPDVPIDVHSLSVDPSSYAFEPYFFEHL